MQNEPVARRRSVEVDMKPKNTKVSRRKFLQGVGTSLLATAALPVRGIAKEIGKSAGGGPNGNQKVLGPGAVPIVLTVNGTKHALQLEPRVTLLEALRDHLDLTGTKEVCDRGGCGACTVLVDGKTAYSCMLLAIEMEGKQITTVEGFPRDAVQEAFVESDAMMCGFCTPGFALSVRALLKENPKPTLNDVKRACAGNLCRCGAYPRVFEAALKAAGVKKT